MPPHAPPPRPSPPPPPRRHAAALLPLLAACSSTGTVTGTATAALTGAPLAGVTVGVDGTTQAGETDERGRFRIDHVAPGPQALVARKEGYTLIEPVHLTVAKGVTVDSAPLRLLPRLPTDAPAGFQPDGSLAEALEPLAGNAVALVFAANEAGLPTSPTRVRVLGPVRATGETVPAQILALRPSRPQLRARFPLEADPEQRPRIVQARVLGPMAVLETDLADGLYCVHLGEAQMFLTECHAFGVDAQLTAWESSHSD